jgi:predicted AlkP superfamily pyrophosphatase or phosphodiesterase
MGRSVDAFVSSWSGVANMLQLETAQMSTFIDMKPVSVMHQDDLTCKAALKALPTSDVCFVYLNFADHAGHSYGFGPQIPQYIEALQQVDRMISPLIQAAHREGMAIAVTTDHGGTARTSMSDDLVDQFFKQHWCKGQCHYAGVHGTDEGQNSLTPHWLTFQCYHTPGSSIAREILPPPTNLDVARRVLELATQSPTCRACK